MKGTARVCLLVSFCSTSVLADVAWRTVALTGQQAPGLAGGVTFSFLGGARMNAAGNAAFAAVLGGTGVATSNDATLWRHSNSVSSLVIREGDAVPGLAGLLFGNLPAPMLSAGGVVGFAGAIVNPAQPTGPVNIGLFVHDGGLQLVAREGQQAAGLPAGMSYTGFTSPAIMASGLLVWQSNAGAGAWKGSAQIAPELVVSEGNPAGGTASNFDYIDAPITADDDLLIRASTDEPTPRFGLWNDPSTSPFAIVGMPVQGQPAGVVPGHISAGGIACAGTCTVFGARLAGPGVVPENDSAILTGSAGGLSVVAREGEAAPGTSASYGELRSQLAVSIDGQVAFVGALAGAGIGPQNNSAIYLAEGASRTLVAREGDPVPGLAGVQFAGFGTPMLAPVGELGFIANLRGQDVTPTNNRALLLRDGAGRLEVAVRCGDLFDTGAGIRTVEEIVIDADQGRGGYSVFESTPAGPTLICKLHFKDPGPNNTVIRSSGLFVATLGAGSCYANCDGSTAQPVLNVADFTCFLQRFAAGESYANCDGSTAAPVLNVADFTCFLQRFAAGCR
jgi:hypothetical protein